VYRFPANPDGSYSPAAAPPAALIRRLNGPSSLALHGGYLYVGETDKISRYGYDPQGEIGGREVIVPNLPTGGHGTRTVAFGPDGMLYVSIGSSCNICQEGDQRRAAVLRYTADGADGERFAWGLRNAVGLAFHPATGHLWVTVNERDNQGNEIPPDLVTAIGPGQNFGWPDCLPPEARPQTDDTDCAGITPPTVGIQAHSAPLGLAFSMGAAFPDEYRGDLFVVQHGSWNRQPPAAPKLMRIRFQGDHPVSAEDFATGWQGPDNRRWGRPAGVIVAPDGSLIVSDDTSGYLYRIAYTG
jgi:glucose/arabinose dehydrogenase